jgi:hypothetical protein
MDEPASIEPLVARAGRPRLDDGKTRLQECRRHGLVEFRHFRDGGAGRWRCRRCVVCGYDRTLVNLHFHHVDPSTKAFGLTISSGKSLAAYTAEARKCVLVCANCHGEIEARVIPCPPLSSCWSDAA